MADGVSEKPTKKVRVLSLVSFWWHVIKKSFKNSWEPFETFGGVCAIFAGIVAIAFLAHLVTQEWGDYMIYWSIAVPVAVWWVFFLWNLIKIPHKKYKEDLTAAISGATAVPVEEIARRNFARVLFVVIIVSAFVALLSVKTLQVAELKTQLTVAQSSQKPPQKPLPEISTPSLKLPPSLPPPTNQPVLALVPPKINSELSVTYKPGEELTNSIAENQQANAARDQAYRQSVDQRWADCLPYYQEAIELFHDILKQAAHAQPQYDEISKSENYFTSLPHSITPEIIGLPLATIGFQKQTNIIFTISIKGDGGSTRPLRISCDSGLFEIHPDGATVSILLNSPAFPVLNIVKDVKTEEWKAFAIKEFSALIDAQSAMAAKNK